MGLPWGSVVKKLPANAGDASSIHGSGRSPGKGNGNPLQYSCLGNPMDRGAWWATVHGAVKEMDMTERLNSNCSYLRRIIIGWGRILCVADAWQRLCLHLLDSRNNPRCHRRTNKKCLQRLPNAPRRPKSCPV